MVRPLLPAAKSARRNALTAGFLFFRYLYSDLTPQIVSNVYKKNKNDALPGAGFVEKQEISGL
jgi:hypothetical protein